MRGAALSQIDIEKPMLIIRKMKLRFGSGIKNIARSKRLA
jgi:hypothetical protein